MKKNKRKPLLFLMVKGLVRLFYPKIKVVGFEGLPGEPCIIVGNHCQLHGPIACELYFPDNFYTWCAAPMMKLMQVPYYAYHDFWSRKPWYTRPFYRVLALIIAPLSVLIFNNARTVPVYRNDKILRTFRSSVAKLQEGNNVVIFPECDEKHNNILYNFQEGFVDIAKPYCKRSGKGVSFVPLYIAPNLRSMYLGKPTSFDPEAPIGDERRRICDYLMSEITEMARALPEHTVVPYRNIPKKLYPKNTDGEVTK